MLGGVGRVFGYRVAGLVIQHGVIAGHPPPSDSLMSFQLVCSSTSVAALMSPPAPTSAASQFSFA